MKCFLRSGAGVAGSDARLVRGVFRQGCALHLQRPKPKQDQERHSVGWRGTVGVRGRRKPPSGVRPSRWRLCVRALAKQCFASKAPSPMGAWSPHPCGSHPANPQCPAFDSFARLLEPAAVGGCRPLVGTGSDPGSVLDSCEFLRWGFPPRPQETIWRRRVTLDRTVGAMDGAIEHHGGDFACPGQGDPPPPLLYQEGA